MTSHTWRLLTCSLTALCCSCLHESASDTNKSSEMIAEVIPAISSTNIVTTNGTTNFSGNPMESPDAVETIVPVSLAKSPGINEIIQLCQSHIEESVILAHIRSSTIAYAPTADEIIYLNDIGISSRIVTALIQRGSALRDISSMQAANTIAVAETNLIGSTVAGSQNPLPSAQPAVILPQNSPQTTNAAVEEEPINETTQFAEPQYVTVDQFYTDLAPYGSWMDVPGYGWSWQPSTVVLQPQWRPYCDSGRWLYTDCGWYWQSDYSWGWAPFHYGRWFRHTHHGWMWQPDTVWGPSWVSWRRSPIYCGWAPLPPQAHYIPGHGFSYHGMMVGSDFGFSLGIDDFTFISYNHFSHQHPSRYFLHRKDAATIYNKCTVINNYHQGPGNVPINNGIDRDQVARISRMEVKKVSIREIPPAAGKIIKPDRIERDGNNLVLYRPTAVKGDALNRISSVRKGPASFDMHGASSDGVVRMQSKNRHRL